MNKPIVKSKPWMLLLFMCAMAVVATAQNAADAYVLSDADVTMSNGSLTACSYEYANTSIIIPNTLDGQTVIEIGSSVFADIGIVELTLPATLLSIGDSAFQYNDLNVLTIHT